MSNLTGQTNTGELRPRAQLDTVLFYGVVIVLAWLVYVIFAPFLVDLTWAAVLVVVSYPIYERLRRRWKPNLASFVSTLGITVVIIVPVLLLMFAFVRQGMAAVESIQAGAASGHFAWLSRFWERVQNTFPDAAPDDLTTTLRHYAEVAAGYVAARMGTVLRHTAEFFFDLGVTILAMFYLYRDGEAIVKRLIEVLPFDAEHGGRILSDAKNLVFASVTSSLVAAAAHGTLGGLAFGITGIRAPIFWGVMMGFFSFIPFVGSALVWVPLSISLMVGGHLRRGVILALICSVVVGMVDNLIRPWLISGRAELPGLVVFISVVGGINAFGMVGVILGPILVATGASLLELYCPATLMETIHPMRVGRLERAC